MANPLNIADQPILLINPTSVRFGEEKRERKREKKTAVEQRVIDL